MPSRDRSGQPNLRLGQLDALKQSFALSRKNPWDLRSPNLLAREHGFSPDRWGHEDRSRDAPGEFESFGFGEVDEARCIRRDLLIHLLSKRSTSLGRRLAPVWGYVRWPS